MKQVLSHILHPLVHLSAEEIESMLEIPKERNRGDYAFPCFVLAKEKKKNPIELAQTIASKVKKTAEVERAEASGPYVNFFFNRAWLASETLDSVFNKRDKYGSNSNGQGKTIVIDMSSPNIAKPFGVGHLRSTMIGNSIAQIYRFSGYKVVRLNYLGDWGTPFGKIIAGYKKYGDSKKLRDNAIKHLYEIYVKVSKDEEFEELGKQEFLKMEQGDKENLALWRQFRELSLNEFDKIYKMLGVSFEVISGESVYNEELEETVGLLKKKGLLEESDGAQVVNLKRFGLGVALIQKSDGATLYMTRDIAAALDRHARYKADSLFYEVGSEQKLHFKQLFTVLELMGHKWAKQCIHINHGLYLDSDGKKFATRKGKTIFMEDVLTETIDLAKKEIRERSPNVSNLNERALTIARAAIVYGDLKNVRSQDIVFDIDRFLAFEGDTGPYLLYSYARAHSILRKISKSKKSTIGELSDGEYALIKEIGRFPTMVREATLEQTPSTIAHYAYGLSQTFNEFYHHDKVLGSEQEAFRLTLVRAFAQTLKNALFLLGIPVLEEM